MPGGPSWRNGCWPARGRSPGTCCARPRRCSPARAALAPARAAARPGRPHLPGGPGLPPAIGPLPAASRSRFAADLLTILRERKAQNYGATVTGTWNGQTQCLGAFIRNRRKLARLSLRQLAEMTSLSNPYLSQLERGLHLPSVRVLKLLSEALNVSIETLLAQAGLLDLAPSGDGAAAADGPPASSVESAISADERLADEQKAALIAVYRSMLRP